MWESAPTNCKGNCAMKNTWTLAMFVATLCLVAWSTYITFQYNARITSLQESQSAKVAQQQETESRYRKARESIEQELQALKARVKITQTRLETVSEPIVRTEQRCSAPDRMQLPFGGSVVVNPGLCTTVPITEIVSRQIQIPVEVDDPEVLSQIKVKEEALTKLSQAATTQLQEAAPAEVSDEVVTKIEQKSAAQQLKEMMVPILTIVFALASLYAIFSGRVSISDKKWAYTTIGTVLGYWFKT